MKEFGSIKNIFTSIVSTILQNENENKNEYIKVYRLSVGRYDCEVCEVIEWKKNLAGD